MPVLHLTAGTPQVRTTRSGVHAGSCSAYASSLAYQPAGVKPWAPRGHVNSGVVGTTYIPWYALGVAGGRTAALGQTTTPPGPTLEALASRLIGQPFSPPLCRH